MKLLGIQNKKFDFSSRQMNESLDTLPEILLDPDLNKNMEILKSAYKDCSDVVFHEFSIGSSIKAVLLYIDGLSNTEAIDQHVLMPLIQMKQLEHGATFENIKKEIPVSAVKDIYNINDIFKQVSAGNSIILIEKETKGISIGLPKWDKRSIMEPD